MIEAQGQVTSPSLSDMFRALTRDDIRNLGFYFWQHGILDNHERLSIVLAERKTYMQPKERAAETGAVSRIECTYERLGFPQGLMLINY